MQQIGGSLKQRYDQIVIQSQMLKAGFASFETLADNNKFRVSRAIR